MEPVVKYSVPTSFNKEDYGTIYKCLISDDLVEHWIQVSKEKENPSWVKFGAMLEKAFECKIDRPEFIHACLKFYEKPPKDINLTFYTYTKT